MTEKDVKDAFVRLQHIQSRIDLMSVNGQEFVDKHLTEEKSLIIDPTLMSEIRVYIKLAADYLERDWISDFFIEHSRLHAYRPQKGSRTGRSPFEEWNLYSSYTQRAIGNAMRKLNIRSPSDFVRKCESLDVSTIHTLREEVYTDRRVQECASESPSFTKAVIQYLFPNSSETLRIFDACAGWGDRLIAAMSLNVAEYTGIEPNTNSLTPFQELIEFFGDSRYVVLPQSMPLGCVPEAKYDLMFFSPPSFDSEMYSLDADQSIAAHPTRGEWIDNFLIPSLHQLVSSIRVGGYLVVQSILIHIIHPLINSFPNLKFMFPIFSNEEKKFRYKPLWIWQKTECVNLIPNKMGLINILPLEMDWSIDECLKGIDGELSMMFPCGTHELRMIPGCRLDPSTHASIARLRYETWKPITYINPQFDTLSSKVEKMWIDDDDASFLHLLISDGQGDLIAACRIRFHRSLSAISGAQWLSTGVLDGYKGGVLSIERTVVDSRYSKSIMPHLPSRGLVYGGGIARMMDTLSIVIAKAYGACGVWCDVPGYRVDALKRMGFTSDNFTFKKSSSSRTPLVEWQGMYLDLSQYSDKRGRHSFYSWFSGYSFHLPFRNLSDIPRQFEPVTFLVSGNSGLNKNALRRVLRRQGSFVEYDESYFVANALKPTIDFLSLEWDSSMGSSLNPYFYEIRSFIKNVVDDACIHILTNKMALHRLKSPYLARTCQLKDVKTVSSQKPLIIRPVGKNACSGNDIYLVSTPNDLAVVKKYFSQLHPKKYETVIASDYIRNPLTFEGKKMHVRMYALVRTKSACGSVSEGLFLFHLGKILTSGESYVDTNHSVLPGLQSNKRIHDTHADSTECNLWFPYNISNGEELYLKMRSVCEELFVPVLKDKITSYTESVNAYEVLGLDFMFDTQLHPYLIEVNTKVGFSTLREPPEVGRSTPFFSSTSVLCGLEDVNMIAQTIPSKGNCIDGLLTFGMFSELIYSWIHRNAIAPFLNSRN